MNSLFPSSSQLSSTFGLFKHQLELRGCEPQGVYEFWDSTNRNICRSRGYQKPKHLWMAKDQSMNLANSTAEVNSEDPNVCSGPPSNQNFVLLSENRFNSQQIAGLTPLRTSCHGISPSNSSSAPGTVAMPSSLTNTSSSPSNHPSPQNRLATNAVGALNCDSPVVTHQSRDAGHARSYAGTPDLKHRRKRGRPPKARSGDTIALTPSSRRKRQPKSVVPPNASMHGNCPDPQPNSNTTFVPGGLKIRLRRDVSMDEPLCGKKFRSRKSSQKSVGIFRIVESWCDADAPGGLAAKSSAISPTSSIQTSGSFRVGDVVWAKLAGYPYWPSRISALYARTPHQLTQVSPENANGDSLAVSATPADPSLAPGFTAKVEWFAWHQFSYLSCAKLFPFLEYFDKLYSPRTRVKNYAEAVTMAKKVITGGNSAPPQPAVLEGEIQTNFPSTSLTLPSDNEIKQPDSSCPLDFHLTLADSNEQKPTDASCPLDLRLAFPPPSLHFPVSSDPVCPESGQFSLLNLNTSAGDFYQLPDQRWAPLPQLDVSGLNDINSSVPTFSEDEDEPNESFAKRLKSQLGSIEI
ncbi:unnamed protein product [Mesocestoides corti]|uniref:PWWP domain-containing protein n=1 Tax=Mesocestoides corti TaxID=53468 RepID=A0A0R3UHL0_MESCO|nr:unnamed protein product [Mesocestoides corti]